REVHIERSFDAFGNLDGISAQGYDHNGQPLPQRLHQIGWGSANGVIGGSGLFPVWEKSQLYPATTRTFDGASGLLLTETDPNGILRVQNQYDAFGRVQQSQHPDGTRVWIDYEWCGIGSAPQCSNGDPASSATGI